jgi:co-chaperonin GroES (HSP10)
LVNLARRGIEVKSLTPPYVVGEDIPAEVAKDNAIYDMILVERYSAPEKTSFGLYLPKVEGKDQKHLGKVLSMPIDYGLESEIGRVQPIEEILPFKVGDIVYLRVSSAFGSIEYDNLIHSIVSNFRTHGVSDRKTLRLENDAFHSIRLPKSQEWLEKPLFEPC